MAHQHDYIWMLAIFGKNSTSTNHNNLYIIWTQILQRFWIWSQKFNIPPVTSYMAISVCFKHISGEIGPPPIMMIYILSGPEFHRDSESEVRNSKFHPWHPIWPHLCFSHISKEIWPPPIMMIYISSGLESHRDSELEVRNSKFHPWNLMWPYLCFSHILEEIWFLPIIMIYISSGPDFHRDFESEVRNSKFHPWHLLWPYLCFSHISEEIWPPPIMVIYHLDQMFTEILNLKSEVQNFTSQIHIWHISVQHIYRSHCCNHVSYMQYKCV